MVVREWKLLSESRHKLPVSQRERYLKNLNLNLVWYIIMTKLIYTNFRINMFSSTSIILSTLVKQLNFSKFNKNQGIPTQHYKSLYKLKSSLRAKPPVSNTQLRPKLFNSLVIVRVFQVYLIGALLSNTVLFKAHTS